MEDLIYILLGLVWIILAVYRNKQKKKLREAAKPNTAESTEEEVYRERDPGSLLEEILLGQQDPKPVMDPETIMTDYDISEGQEVEGTRFTTSKPTLEFEEEYNRLGITSEEELDKDDAGKADPKKENSDLEVEIMGKEEGGAGGFDFDLKKAVIYSEILNRQHF
jgi:hypothetical protein